MKKHPLLFLVLAVTCALPLPAIISKKYFNTSAMEKEKLLAAEKQWCQVHESRNFTAMAGMMAEDFIGISHTGKVVDKQQYLSVHQKPELTFKIFRTQGVDVRMAADAAILAGEILILHPGEERKKPDQRYIAFYRKDNGGNWKIVAWQDTPMQPDQ